MKKTIITLLCSVVLFTSCALSKEGKAIPEKKFKNYFDKKSETYEFNIRNPLFFDEFYIKDIKSLKNKIIKVTQEKYSVGKDGRKSYSDSYIRDVMHKYYIFDSEGHITDYYYLDINDNDIVFRKIHEKYEYTEDSIIINEFDLRTNKEKKYTGLISEKDSELTIKFDNKYKISNKISFKKDFIRKTSRFNEDVDYTDYTLKNNLIDIKNYSITASSERDLYVTRELENCAEIKWSKPAKKARLNYEYQLDENGDGILSYKLIENNEVIDEKIESRVKRKFNDIGFMELAEEKPYESEEGDYYFMKAEVLNNPDKIWNENFE